jgi:hypothetical protein
MRVAQVICGFAAFFLALWFWWLIFLLPPTYGKTFDSHEAEFCLEIAGPGLCMAIGGFLQATYRWAWPAGLVLPAGAVAAFFGFFLWFMFGYIGYKSTLPLVYTYLGLIPVTMAISLINAITEMVRLFPETGAEQVGRERRERVS